MKESVIDCHDGLWTDAPKEFDDRPPKSTSARRCWAIWALWCINQGCPSPPPYSRTIASLLQGGFRKTEARPATWALIRGLERKGAVGAQEPAVERKRRAMGGARGATRKGARRGSGAERLQKLDAWAQSASPHRRPQQHPPLPDAKSFSLSTRLSRQRRPRNTPSTSRSLYLSRRRRATCGMASTSKHMGGDTKQDRPTRLVHPRLVQKPRLGEARRRCPSDGSARL